MFRMSSFPPKDWVVRHLQDMASITFQPPKDDSVRLDALLAVRPAEGEEGSYRFVLASSRHVDMLIPVDLVLDDPSFKGMNIEAQLELGTQVKHIYSYWPCDVDHSPMFRLLQI